MLSYLAGCHVPDAKVSIKTEAIKKLSNFNFQWTKTLYQNILSLIAFFPLFFHTFLRVIDVISYL